MSFLSPLPQSIDSAGKTAADVGQVQERLNVARLLLHAGHIFIFLLFIPVLLCVILRMIEVKLFTVVELLYNPFI